MGIFRRLGARLAGVSVANDIPAEYVVYEIQPYQYNELGYAHWQGFLSNFSSIRESFFFTVSGNKTSIKLYMSVPRKYESYVVDMFYTSFPSSEIKKTAASFAPLTSYLQFSGGVEFFGADQYSAGGTYVDPFKEVLGYYFSVPEGGTLTIQYEAIFKVKLPWRKKVLHRFSQQLSTKEREEKEEKKDALQKKEVKQAGRDVLFMIGYGCKDIDQNTKKYLLENVVNIYSKFIKEGSVKKVSKKCKVYGSIGSYINMFHVPTKVNQNKSLSYIPYRKLAYPVDLPTLHNTAEQDITVLGEVDFKSDNFEFGIQKEDKFRHVYIVGKTGMGKSTFISNMVRSDMVRGNGIAVVDPHGDLIDDVIAHIPSHRTNDVFVFDVSDTSYPVGFNILEVNSPDEKNLIASAVVSIFKKLFAHSRGPRLEYILRNVMLSILEYPNATLMHVMRMLTDKNFREDVLSNVSDPVVMKFRRDEYDTRQEKQRNEAVGPIANKIGQFLSSPIVRNIFAQPKSSLHIRKLMDEGKILLINLSKGKIGEDNASMIGSFLVSKFQIDAMSRADVPFKQRKDFYLYIDEFQNFATDSFESILSEARKYRLSLIVANQYTSQIEENVRNAIFGNVGTIISFGLGYDDATMMSLQFKEVIEANDLLSLPKFTAYVKLMVKGVVSEPFSMKTFPLPEPTASAEIRAKIREQSRQRYAIEKQKLESLLKARSERTFTKAEKVMDAAKAQATKDDGSQFSFDDIVLGTEYSGLVKLKFNYGLFVTVKGVEGLLHKSQIVVPHGVESRKGLYEIGDNIEVYALEWKEINDEKRIVWSQKRAD